MQVSEVWGTLRLENSSLVFPLGLTLEDGGQECLEYEAKSGYFVKLASLKVPLVGLTSPKIHLGYALLSRIYR
jgi:hypothetical protein